MNGNVLFYFILVCIYCTTWNNFQANKENTIPTILYNPHIGICILYDRKLR